MCDLDEVYLETGESSIDDETLIALVKNSRYLYDKKEKDFKNTAMKKDTWTAISTGCGATSGEAVEARWNQLRNQYGRKLRERKEKKPSGSGAGKMPTVSPLAASMSFLLPHMESRKKRGTNEVQRSATPQLDIEPSSRANTPQEESDCPVRNPTSSMWDSTSQIFMSEDSQESVVTVDQEDKEPEERRSAILPIKRKTPVVPAADSFAKKKKRSWDGMEGIMQQSANAMQIVAQSLSTPEVSSPNEKKAELNEHPYITAIREAFANVRPGKELECFMAILNIIKEYSSPVCEQ